MACLRAVEVSETGLRSSWDILRSPIGISTFGEFRSAIVILRVGYVNFTMGKGGKGLDKGVY
jgi:hypothetical protein